MIVKLSDGFRSDRWRDGILHIRDQRPTNHGNGRPDEPHSRVADATWEWRPARNEADAPGLPSWLRNQEATMSTTTVEISSRRLSWSGIFAGALAAVMVQVLSTMLGLGIGILSFDRTSDAAAVSWSAFAWWAIGGIIASFVGGFVASRAGDGGRPALQGLGAWALSAVIVIGATSLAATGGAGVMANLTAPGFSTPLPEPATTGAGAATATKVPEHAGGVMLGGVIALVLGAFAGWAGARMGIDRDIAAGTARRG
jgi:hypothetical protein